MSEQASQKPKPNKPVKIIQSQRNKLEKRITEKFRLVKSSICSEQVDEAHVKQQMLEQKGVLVPATELAAQHKDLLQQREELIEPHIQTARNDLTVRLQELDMQKKEEIQAATNQFKQDMAALKARLSATKREIETRFDGERSELQRGLEEVRTEQLELHAGEISKKLNDIKRKEIEVREVEKMVDMEASSRLSFLRRQAGRINQIIDDAQNRILEELMFVTTMDEAKELLERVPTVASILELVDQGVEGLQSLIQRVNPEAAQAMNSTPLLSAPSQSNEDEAVEVQAVQDNDPYSDDEVYNSVEAMRTEDESDAVSEIP